MKWTQVVFMMDEIPMGDHYEPPRASYKTLKY